MDIRTKQRVGKYDWLSSRIEVSPAKRKAENLAQQLKRSSLGSFIFAKNESRSQETSIKR